MNILVTSKIKNLVEALRQAGVKLEQDASEAARNLAPTLSGKTFVITGSMTKMERPGRRKKLLRRGEARRHLRLVKKLTIWLSENHPGSKLAKAQELGIKMIIDEKRVFGAFRFRGSVLIKIKGTFFAFCIDDFDRQRWWRRIGQGKS